ncbi:MAG: LPXTG cell wall anchor domain-containing protein [Blautia sp.]
MGRKSGTTSTGSIAKNVKTGDETNISLYLSAGLMALMAGAGAVVIRRRKR